jgi:hypothetical protein
MSGSVHLRTEEMAALNKHSREIRKIFTLIVEVTQIVPVTGDMEQGRIFAVYGLAMGEFPVFRKYRWPMGRIFGNGLEAYALRMGCQSQRGLLVRRIQIVVHNDQVF